MSRKPVDLPAGARVLLRLPNWLGDVILCTPALQALAAARPDLRLSALVKPGVVPAVEGLPGIERVIPLPPTTAAGTLRAARGLGRWDFAACLIFPKGLREALLCLLAGIPVRVGLDTDHRSLLLTHPVAFTKEDWARHHALQFAKVLEPLGLGLREERALFPLAEEDRSEAGRILEAHAMTPRSYAAFHVGASKPPRAWHPERFGEVARRLLSGHGLVPVLLGVPSDARAHEAFKVVCPQAKDLAGETTLRGMAAVIGEAALFVGNDSGPMHIAAALATPAVAAFGPGSPGKTEPWNPVAPFRSVTAELPCSPCRQSFFKDCDPSPAGKPPCLEALSVETVLRACEEVLGK